jgi:hypothetical protein
VSDAYHRAGSLDPIKGSTVEPTPLNEQFQALNDEIDNIYRVLNALAAAASATASSGISQLTGDVTAGPGSGSQVATLSASGVTAATYGDSSHVAQVTVDAKGRVTAASNVAVSGGSGKLAQVVNTETGAVATGTTTIPFDDTKPQNTEGTEFLTLTVTPTDAAHKLEIEVQIWATVTGTNWMIVALFQDSGADALAAVAAFTSTSTAGGPIVLRHTMVAGTTSSTTFKVRMGPNAAATVTLNGQSGGRIFGGVAASSMTISEIVP